jgi:hypothetical protein
MSLAEIVDDVPQAPGERSPARTRLADRIAAIEPARQHEAALIQALEDAEQLARDAQAALDARQEALKASGQSLAAQLVKAAQDGAAVATNAATDPQGAAAEAQARADLVQAQAAKVELKAELEAARSAMVSAKAAVDRAAQGVLLEATERLISEGQKLKAELGVILDEIMAVEKVGGLPAHDGAPWTPYPLSVEARTLLFGHKPGRLPVERWQDLVERLKTDADAS